MYTFSPILGSLAPGADLIFGAAKADRRWHFFTLVSSRAVAERRSLKPLLTTWITSTLVFIVYSKRRWPLPLPHLDSGASA